LYQITGGFCNKTVDRGIQVEAIDTTRGYVMQ
jgi:hypothetical protein